LKWESLPDDVRNQIESTKLMWNLEGNIVGKQPKNEDYELFIDYYGGRMR
jgi:hypothetical protein